MTYWQFFIKKAHIDLLRVEQRVIESGKSHTDTRGSEVLVVFVGAGADRQTEWPREDYPNTKILAYINRNKENQQGLFRPDRRDAAFTLFRAHRPQPHHAGWLQHDVHPSMWG